MIDDADLTPTQYQQMHPVPGAVQIVNDQGGFEVMQDPAKLIAPVPAAIPRAVELVRTNKPASITTEEADRFVEALEAPYPERVVHTIRAAMGADATGVEKVE